MPLPAKAFQRWLQDIAPDTSTADICRISGIKRTTLAQQLVRGKVAGTTVVSISRAFNINPVDALAAFDEFRELSGPARPPTRGELVSQVSTPDLLRAVLARSAVDPAAKGSAERPGLGPAPQNYSAQLTANRLTPELALATSLAAGVGPAGGLVASGLITEEEAGWPPHARQNALDSLSDGELATLAGDRLLALGGHYAHLYRIQSEAALPG